MIAHLEAATHLLLRILAHSHLSHFQQRSSTGLWTVAGCGVSLQREEFR
jgi:hypothetical protein